MPTCLTADLFLLHAPSVYDFRNRDDVLFAYLSDSDSTNVTSIFEMYPLGFLNIKQHLANHDIKAEIVNIASLMLQHPHLDVGGLLKQLDAPVFGLDLHWMAQCHGAIEVAIMLKRIHPNALILFGGISSTYYAQELIGYPCVDVVVQGYDTLEPLHQLIQEVRKGKRNFDHIPNLIYKDESHKVISTGFDHKPINNYNDTTVDWSFYNGIKNTPTSTKLIMTLPNSGCRMNCPWCGGSSYSYRNMMGVSDTLIKKDIGHVLAEMRTMGDAAKGTSIYALQCYSETQERFHQYLETVKEMQYKSVSFELNQLPDTNLLRKMSQSTQAFIMLSPESHDRSISKAAGRGQYSMSEMEAWIPKALDAGIAGIMVWFFIGMPGQTAQSVMETVEYSKSLMEKFRGANVSPLICPMVPFLDPGSRFFEEPDKHGYRIYHRTLADHRSAMVQPLWYQRLNYETRWLSRQQIQEVTYTAISQLVTIKAELGILPSTIAQRTLDKIEHTQQLLATIEAALDMEPVLPLELRGQIREYNKDIFSYSSDQLVPIRRQFGGRWFDDYTIPSSMINELSHLK